MSKISYIFSVFRDVPNPLKFLLARVLKKVKLNKFLVINRRSYKIRFSRSNLSMILWVNPDRRVAEESVIQSCLRPGSIFIDIGANIGTTSLAASSVVGEMGQVFAFEANPKTFVELVGNIELNNIANISPFLLAAGSSLGVVGVTDMEADDQNYVSQLEIERSRWLVPMVALDDLLPASLSVDLLKVDVEGFENDVLIGARNVLSRTSAVMIEVSQENLNRHGSSLGLMLNELISWGFVEFQILDDVKGLLDASVDVILHRAVGESFDILVKRI